MEKTWDITNVFILVQECKQQQDFLHSLVIKIYSGIEELKNTESLLNSGILLGQIVTLISQFEVDSNSLHSEIVDYISKTSSYNQEEETEIE